MKIRFYKKLIIVIVILITIPLTNCEKEEPIKDFYAVDVSQESEWDYLAVAKDGSSLLFRDIKSSEPTVYVKPVKDEAGFIVSFTSSLLPKQAIIDDHIIIFGNFRKTLVDISVIEPDGSILLLNDIPVEHDLTYLIEQKGSILDFSDVDLVKVLGISAGVASCAIGIISVPATIGLSTALTVASCGATILSIIAEIKGDEILDSQSAALGTISTFISCANKMALDCILGLIEIGTNIYEGFNDKISSNQENITVATSSLNSGLVVITNNPGSVSNYSATIGGNIVPGINVSATEKGVYISTSSSPFPDGLKKIFGSGGGTFAIPVNNLIPNTTYYYVAYATNEKGTTLGVIRNFKTTRNSLVVFQNSTNIFSMNPDGTSLTQLTTSASTNLKPRLNYQKTKIAFISNRTGRYEIYKMNLDGTGVEQLTTTGVRGGQNNNGPGGLDWTPEGKIVYINGTKLLMMNDDGTNVTEITTAPENYWCEVRVSPLGNLIMAQTQGSWGYILKMYKMSITGTNRTLFASDLAGVQFMGDFSPDGQYFLYSYDVSGHEESSGQSWNDQIIKKRIDGTSEVNLSANKIAGSNDIFPDYTADGEKIIFMNNVTAAGTMHLWVMNADGSNRTKILEGGPWYGIDVK